jgi:hypothetical protein
MRCRTPSFRAVTKVLFSGRLVKNLPEPSVLPAKFPLVPVAFSCSAIIRPKRPLGLYSVFLELWLGEPGEGSGSVGTRMYHIIVAARSRISRECAPCG